MTTDRIDLLLCRIVDGGAAASEWTEFAAAADADPSLWRDLAGMQRDHARLREVVADAAAVADRVALPTPASTSSRPSSAGWRPVLFRLAGWSGWAIAASLVLAWFFGRDVAPVPANAGVVTADHCDTAACGYQTYLERGKEEGLVLGELPSKVLIKAGPNPEGEGYELLYLRQILERVIVPDFYRTGGQDEAGKPTLIQFSPPASGAM
ncbi:MAG: hypothetical protein KDA25_02430 [Phycisphaerales bacterium]|nr:hypothetical protein [Phycisphaerales bacterium]